MSVLTLSRKPIPAPIITPPTITLPTGTTHTITHATADTLIAYEGLIGDEQRWTDHSSHPARVCRQKTVRDDAGNKITVRPPLEGNRL